MTAHTPGPWRRAPDAGRFRHDHSAGIEGPNGTYVATALDFNRSDRDEEVEANARLIAAAPEMYAALVTLIHNGPMPQTGKEKRAYQTAAIAVAKAEGRES